MIDSKLGDAPRLAPFTAPNAARDSDEPEYEPEAKSRLSGSHGAITIVTVAVKRQVELSLTRFLIVL